MCLEYFNKKVKKMTVWDVGSVKLAVVACVLFIISFLHNSAIIKIVELKWLWLIFFIFFAIKPIIKILSK